MYLIKLTLKTRLDRWRYRNALQPCLYMSTHAEREERGQVLKRDHTYKHTGLKQAAGGWRGWSLHSLGLIKTPSTASHSPWID